MAPALFKLQPKPLKEPYFPCKNQYWMTFKDMNGVVTHDSVYMSSIEGDSIWIGTIPQKSIGTRVNYSVYAYDTAGNYGTAYSAYLIGGNGFLIATRCHYSHRHSQTGCHSRCVTPVVVNIENRGLKT